jgi:hypothetical protein
LSWKPLDPVVFGGIAPPDTASSSVVVNSRISLTLSV